MSKRTMSLADIDDPTGNLWLGHKKMKKSYNRADILKLIRDADQNEVFVIGAILRPVPYEEQPDIGLTFDLNDLSFPLPGDNWSEPQIYISNILGKHYLFIEDYPNDQSNTILQEEVILPEATDIIITLSQKYQIIDTLGNSINISHSSE